MENFTILVIYKAKSVGDRENFVKELTERGVLTAIRNEDGCFAYDYYFSNEIMWEFSIYSQILELFALLGQYQYGTTLHDSKLDKSSSENFEKFATLVSYIDSHYATELDLEQAAALVGFSKFHFSRLFKEFTNCTFYDYLSQARIQAAQRLLSTNTSITDIAFQTGFNSLSSFCRCFKKYTNLSPSEYRDLYVKS